MARQKPKVMVLADLKEADAALAELAGIKRDLAAGLSLAAVGNIIDAFDN